MIKKYLIEIKPQRQTTPPPKPQRQTQGYIREAYEYAKKNPFLEIDGVVKELGIEKSSSSMKPKESVRSVLQ